MNLTKLFKNTALAWGIIFSLAYYPAKAQPQQLEKVVYTFGVVPQLTPREIAHNWIPILHALEEKTGFKFQLRGTINIPDFESDFLNGEFDFAYMNPYHSLIASENEGYQPIIRDKSKKLFGILVVKKGSNINSLKDLEGKTLAFPAPNALGASLLIRSALNEQGINYHTKYVQTHSSVYLNVALGVNAAGGGVMRTFNSQPEEIQSSLKVIYETIKVNPHPIVAHGRVPKEHVQTIKDAFFAIAATPQGKELLSKIPMGEITQANIEDYSNLKETNIQNLYRQD